MHHEGVLPSAVHVMRRMNHATATRSASTGSALISRSLVTSNNTNATQPPPPSSSSQNRNNKPNDNHKSDPREKFRSDSAWIRRPSSQSDPPQLGSNQDHQPSTESKDPVGVGENNRGDGIATIDGNNSSSSSSRNDHDSEKGGESGNGSNVRPNGEKSNRGDVFVRPLSRMRPPAGKPAATWNEVTDIDDIEDDDDDDDDDDAHPVKWSEGKEEKGEGKQNDDSSSGRDRVHLESKTQGKSSPKHRQSKDDDDLSGVDQWDAMVPVSISRAIPRESHHR